MEIEAIGMQSAYYKIGVYVIVPSEYKTFWLQKKNLIHSQAYIIESGSSSSSTIFKKIIKYAFYSLKQKKI